jgi:hypothetical protein
MALLGILCFQLFTITINGPVLSFEISSCCFSNEKVPGTGNSSTPSISKSIKNKTDRGHSDSPPVLAAADFQIFSHSAFFSATSSSLSYRLHAILLPDARAPPYGASFFNI